MRPDDLCFQKRQVEYCTHAACAGVKWDVKCRVRSYQTWGAEMTQQGRNANRDLLSLRIQVKQVGMVVYMVSIPVGTGI